MTASELNTSIRSAEELGDELLDAAEGAASQDQTTYLINDGRRYAAIVPVEAAEEWEKRFETAGPQDDAPEPGSEPMVRVFSWHWKSQPPMEEIGKFVSEIFARGREFHMREYVPGDDCRWWIVSDYAVDDDEAEHLYEVP